MAVNRNIGAKDLDLDEFSTRLSGYVSKRISGYRQRVDGVCDNRVPEPQVVGRQSMECHIPAWANIQPFR